MKRPYELLPMELEERLDEMVFVTMSDLTSEFLMLPMGSAFIEYPDFSAAYEVLKRTTVAFRYFNETTVMQALLENSRVLGVLRAILGMTPPEWGELARTECQSDITQGAARTLDRRCRENPNYVRHVQTRNEARQKQASSRDSLKTLDRIKALISVAVRYASEGAPSMHNGFVHRLDKFDTKQGLESVQYAASEDVPYAVLLYERYLGRPFAGHRDAVSELVGEVMENVIEERLRKAGVGYRKTGRAERIPGFGQAPDFCIPDEINPVVIIEAKITSDDGTARDKVARIKELETQRRTHASEGRWNYEVVACIDGRGFRERKEDMRQLLLRLGGKVFTSATLDHILTHTRIQEFVAHR